MEMLQEIKKYVFCNVQRKNVTLQYRKEDGNAKIFHPYGKTTVLFQLLKVTAEYLSNPI